MNKSVNRKKVLFHYTSIKSLMNILDQDQNGEICLRATNARYFNDPFEFNLAVSMLKTSMFRYEKENSITKKKSQEFDRKGVLSFGTIAGHPFLVSFSENSDDLTMWRTYGSDGRGVAIGFDAQALVEYENAPGVVNTNFIKCSYNKNMILKNLIKYWSEEYDNITFDKKTTVNSFNMLFDIGRLCYSIKRREYKDEKEYRLCRNERNPEKIKFLERNGIVVPFVELHLKKEIIRKIIVGPCVNKKLTTESLQFFLRSKGYPFSKDFIQMSSVPYRII